MAWVISYVVLGVAGIAVLAVAGVRVYIQVRGLSREVSRARQRLAESGVDLQALAGPRQRAGAPGPRTSRPAAVPSPVDESRP